MDIDPQIIAGYDKIGAKWRMTHSARDGILARVIDKTTGTEYAKAGGATEPDAIANALEAARSADKPLTRAQAEDPVYANAKATAAALEAANARIAELEARPRAGGRRAKPEPPPETETAVATAASADADD